MFLCALNVCLFLPTKRKVLYISFFQFFKQRPSTTISEKRNIFPCHNRRFLLALKERSLLCSRQIPTCFKRKIPTCFERKNPTGFEIKISTLWDKFLLAFGERFQLALKSEIPICCQQRSGSLAGKHAIRTDNSRTYSAHKIPSFSAYLSERKGHVAVFMSKPTPTTRDRVILPVLDTKRP